MSKQTINLVDVFADALTSEHFGMEPAVAQTLAEGLIKAAAARGHGGCDYYLPMHRHLSRSDRNARIRQEFTGGNLREICRRYQVTKTTVYRIVRRHEETDD